jgi:hypothetical protein
MDIDEPLLVFRGQYFQCLDPDFLAWPPGMLLKQPDARRFLLKYLFQGKGLDKLPPSGYQSKVLSILLSKIEKLAKPDITNEVSRRCERLSPSS